MQKAEHLDMTTGGMASTFFLGGGSHHVQARGSQATNPKGLGFRVYIRFNV